MGNALRGPREARGQRAEGAALGRAGLALQGGAEDPLHAAAVEQLKGQSPRTGRVDARGAVALRQAQELLGLSQPRPGEGPAQEHARELPDGGPDLLGPADAGVRGAHREGARSAG